MWCGYHWNLLHETLEKYEDEGKFGMYIFHMLSLLNLFAQRISGRIKNNTVKYNSLISTRSVRFAATHRKTSGISRALVGNKIVGKSDVVGASPVGAAPTTSSFSTKHLATMDWTKTTAQGYKKHLNFGIWCDLY